LPQRTDEQAPAGTGRYGHCKIDLPARTQKMILALSLLTSVARERLEALARVASTLTRRLG